ncbi:MAG: cell division protein ZapE [Brevundimonas sp.]
MPSLTRAAYDRRLQSGALTADPAQETAIAALSRLERDLDKGGRLFRKPPRVKGLYLWGPPGRGKSLLMDLFYAEAPEPRKTRAHFHAFMARVHDLIRQWREGDAAQRKAVFGQWKGDDPIAPAAALIASEARLLCFDELQVTDIADAMILGRLFEALFEHRVVLAITSNRAPDDLYLNGINRPLFEPFIHMIQDRCAVVQMAGGRDWRLDRMKAHRAWLSPLDDEARAEFDGFWDELKGDEPEEPAHLSVAGRDVVIERTAGGLARATFAELCARPLGASDYLAMARRFHTLFLEDVPVLGPDRPQEARRLVTLIDALYEARTRLVVLAEAAPEALYPEGVGAFEFERTVSRLNQMSGADWLEQADAA